VLAERQVHVQSVSDMYTYSRSPKRGRDDEGGNVTAQCRCRDFSPVEIDHPKCF
jgi:hypothetical protein